MSITNVRGFSLLEVAIALLLFGVFVSGLVQLGSAAQSNRNAVLTENELEAIVHALYGFALLNNRLPCPDVDSDYVEDLVSGSCSASSGNIPARDIGVRETDVLGKPFQYEVDVRYTTANAIATVSSVVKDDATTIENGNGIGTISSSVTSGVATSPITARISHYVLVARYLSAGK